jgi:hypothetical protein
MLAAALLLLAHPPQTRGEEAPLAIAHVTVIDLESGATDADRTVLVRGDRIAAVEASAELDLPERALVIDGRGRFLIPGLVDAHVHVTERDLPLFLANGVTAIRELNGSSAHLAMRARIAAGELLGPRVKVTSPLLAGERQRWRHELLLDPLEAGERAEAFADAGYDALKVYDGLGREVYDVLAEVARDRSLPLVGHVPSAVGLDRVLAARQGIEHVEQIVRATVGHALEPERIGEIAALVARAGVTVTPTLAAQEILAHTARADFAARFERPEIAYVERDILEWWQSLRSREHGNDSAAVNPYYAFQAALVRAMAEAGVTILVGTDTPNPLLVPGFSIHDELAALVGAGLKPSEVLRAATVGAAGCLGWKDQGRIAPGQVADLVLLEGDPRASLGLLRRPVGVVAAGRWLDRTALDALVAPLARED